MTFRTLIGPRDPRVYSGLLARKTLRQLEEHREKVATEPVALIILNFVRLLEMYRFKVMHRRPAPAGILQSVPLVLAEETIDDQEIDPLQVVEHAFEEARTKAPGNEVLEREPAANKVKETLTWHLQTPSGTRPADADINYTVSFLKTFVEALSAKPKPA